MASPASVPVVLLGGALLAALACPAHSDPHTPADTQPRGLATIVAKDAERFLEVVASPWHEGRDTPSAGLDLVATWLAAQLSDFGLQPAPGHTSFIVPWSRAVDAPDETKCRLEFMNQVSEGSSAPQAFALGTDFVPLLGASGSAEGPLVFAGFGVSAPGYDDLGGLRLDGAVALVFEGEPRHRKVLEGPELSPASNVFRKLDALAAKGAKGALIVRRPPPDDPPRPEGFPEVAPLGFRYSWGRWVGERPEPEGPGRIPALEISLAAAERLAGTALEPWATELDKRGRPKRFELPPAADGEAPRVRFEAALARRDLPMPNVIGVVPGRDADAADDYLVVGAHFDHVGVDPRGRIGVGADDNGSGTVATLLAARALVTAQPRRPVLVCFFSGEEDGLLGAAALLENPPVPVDRMAFMLNLDMVGRGPKDSLAAIGAQRTEGLERVLLRARKLGNTGVRNLDTRGGNELWERSDHYEFVKRGVPAMFIFEELPIEKNRDYHTWRDTLDLVDPEKVARAARLGFNLLWLVAEDDDLLPRPRQ